LLQSNADVTKSNAILDIDIDIDKDIEIDNKGSSEPKTPKPTSEETAKDNDVSYPDTYHDTSTNRIPYQDVIDIYNNICISLPRVTTLSDSRKKAIRARFNTGYTLDNFKQVFLNAQNSDFLKGKNDRNWHATFDWLIKDANMAKVLDGNYANNRGATKKKYTEDCYGD
jgi:uncharacterized phage protein (TIGR02220 family)